MSKFKVGDRVRVLRHRNWRGDDLGQDYGIEKGTIVLLVGIDEDMSNNEFTMFAVEDLGDGYSWIIRSDDIEPVIPSPIRTVTRREIVPGEYTLPSGGEYEVSECDDGPEWIAIDDHDYDAVGLREMAAIFNQLAEVLEENAQ